MYNEIMDIGRLTREEKERLYISKAAQLNIRHIEIGEDLEDGSKWEEEAHRMNDSELDKVIQDTVGQIKFEKGHNIFVWVVVLVAVVLIALLFKFF